MALTPEESATDIAFRQLAHFRANKDKPLKDRTAFNPHAKGIGHNDVQLTDEYMLSMIDETYKAKALAKQNELRGIQTHTGVGTLSVEDLENKQTQYPSLLDG